MKTLNLGLIGLGTVGSGLVTLLQRNAALIAERYDCRFQIKAIAVRDLQKARSCTLPTEVLLTTDPQAVVAHPEVDVVVELIGGTTTAKAVVEQALARGLPVVTANKALLADSGTDLFRLAAEKKLPLAYEAAVAGGIPIINVLSQGIAGNRIFSLAGIINGTCNYILSAMTQEGRAFADVLAEAQAKGYAEADPSFDIDGLDAGHKLALLASLTFALPIMPEALQLQGIRHVTALDIRFAEELGFFIKHLAVAQCDATENPPRYRAEVAPMLVPKNSLLAQVHGAMNAVLVTSDALGKSLYYGAGAGAEPTATAVLADLIKIARGTLLPPSPLPTQAPAPWGNDSAEFYLRLAVRDAPGVLASISKILADQGISIEAVLQKAPEPPTARAVPLIIVTHQADSQALATALASIRALPVVEEAVNCLRIMRF
jgi:homoserine dehydrogenase